MKSRAKRSILLSLLTVALIAAPVAANASSETAEFTIRATDIKNESVSAAAGLNAVEVIGDGSPKPEPVGRMTFQIGGESCDSYTVEFGNPSEGSKLTLPDGSVRELPESIRTGIRGKWKIDGQFDSFSASGNQCLTSVDEWHNTKTKSIAGAFSETQNLTSVVDFPSTVTDFSNAFADSRFNGSTTYWTTPNAVNMRGMFLRTSEFNQPFPKGFSTKKVTSMKSMFERASSFNQPINFSTPSLKNTANMFTDASSFNGSFGAGFDTSNVVEMYEMFAAARSFNKPVLFKTGKVENMAGMFQAASSFNQPISFDTADVVNISWMFNWASSFNQDVSSLNVDKAAHYEGFGTNSPIAGSSKIPLKFR